MPRYQAYGLVFDSDLELPEFPASEDQAPGPTGTRAESPEVRICLGEVPAALAAPSARGVTYEAAPDTFLLKLDRVARYLVRGGSEIVVEPAAGSLASDVRVFLLGSAIGALLHQRGLLVLHASGIASREHGAILFAGASGAGKSTLLGELMRRGHRMLVDDVCAVSLDEERRPVAHPAYPRTRLWVDAARRLEHDVAGLPRTRPTLEKYERQVPEQFHAHAEPIRHLVTLTSENREGIELHQLAPFQRFGAVLHNTYRRTFLSGLEMRDGHFALATAVARQVPVTRVVRPTHPFLLAELADRIEALWA